MTDEDDRPSATSRRTGESPSDLVTPQHGRRTLEGSEAVQDYIQALKRNIAQASTPEEAERWVRVLHWVHEIESRARDAKHGRFLEMLQVAFKMGFSVAAFGSGVALALAGHSVIGFLFWELDFMALRRITS